jgi:hypothetical protein
VWWRGDLGTPSAQEIRYLCAVGSGICVHLIQQQEFRRSIRITEEKPTHR